MQSFEKLEAEFSDFMSRITNEEFKTTPEQMVACSSGTAALHLAVEADKYEICDDEYILSGKKKRWIVPDFAMVACARACSLAGMSVANDTLQFVDCNEYLLMDEKKLQERVKLNNYDEYQLMLVDIYGHTYLPGFLQGHQLLPKFILQDMAETHGVKPHPLADSVAWSFYKNKIIHGEEGGMVWFKNPKLAKLARVLRNLGQTERHDFIHLAGGHNYRMSNCHADLILKSLARYDKEVADRWKSWNMYEDRICQRRISIPDSPWVFVIEVTVPWKAGVFVQQLNDHGIAARRSFQPMSIQPEFATPQKGKAHELSKRILYLPLMNPEELKNRIDTIAYFL